MEKQPNRLPVRPAGNGLCRGLGLSGEYVQMIPDKVGEGVRLDLTYRCHDLCREIGVAGSYTHEYFGQGG